MDPLSVTTAAFALFDVCRRTFEYLRKLQQSMRDIHGVIEDLNRDIDTICGIVSAIQQTTGRYTQSDLPSPDHDVLSLLLKGCHGSLNGCETIAKEIAQIVDVISGKGGNAVTGKLDALGKEFRRRRQAGPLEKLKRRLMEQKQDLQILLNALN